MYSLEIDHILNLLVSTKDRRSLSGWKKISKSTVPLVHVHFTIFYRTRKFYFVWPNMQDWWVVLGVQLPMHAEDFLATPLDQC